MTLGDGNSLDVARRGTVYVDMILNDGGRRRCALREVLYIPELAYNLISVSRAIQSRQSVIFDDPNCEFVNAAGETTAIGARRGSLYYLSCAVKPPENVCVTRTDARERLWHRRFGHLNEQSMRKLVREEPVDYLDNSTSGEIGVCEACIGGKQSKSPIEQSRAVTLMPLELRRVREDGSEVIGWGGVLPDTLG